MDAILALFGKGCHVPRDAISVSVLAVLSGKSNLDPHIRVARQDIASLTASGTWESRIESRA